LNTGGYTLRNIKTFQGIEMQGYNVTLARDGKKVASVIDEGAGGAPFFHWDNKGCEKEFYAFLKTLPKEKSEWDDKLHEVSDEVFIGDLFNDTIQEKDFIKKCKTKTLYRTSDMSNLEYGSLNMPYCPEAVSYLREQLGDKLIEIINERYPDLTPLSRDAVWEKDIKAKCKKKVCFQIPDSKPYEYKSISAPLTDSIIQHIKKKYPLAVILNTLTRFSPGGQQASNVRKVEVW